MNYLKFTQFAYLIAGILFAFDSYSKWSKGENVVISVAFAGVCFFMFFFRKGFGKKFDQHNKKP